MALFLSHLEEARAEDLAQKRAEKLGFKYLAMKTAGINTDALKIIPLQKARLIKALVFEKRIKEFDLAAVNPEIKETQDLIKEIKKFGKVNIFVVSSIAFEKYLENYQLIPKDKPKRALKPSGNNRKSKNSWSIISLTISTSRK